MTDLDVIYNQLSETYEEKYVAGGVDNPYMRDELAAGSVFCLTGLNGKIISLGVGSGQDIEITGYPIPKNFVGYDFSAGMLKNATYKFPSYRFVLHDCREMIPHEQADVLVSMFGAPNYLGADKLIEHYRHLGCHSAFFVFYNENYHDGIADEYHMYTQERLEVAFSEFNAHVMPLFDGSNYYVVWWDENRNL